MPKLAAVAPVVVPLALACGLLGPTGCGPTSGGTDLDAGASCTSADTPHCEGQSWLSCEGGKWQSELCAQPLKCVDGLGCRTCKPNDGYCSSQDSYVCNADGTAWDLVATCKPDEQCVLGGCFTACDQAATSRSNVGCEFWAVDLPNEYYCQSINGGQTCFAGMFGYGCAACEQFAVAIANTSDFQVTVTIEQNDAPPSETASLSLVDQQDVGPYSLRVFPLPMREVDCTEWYTDSAGKLRRRGDSRTCLSSRAYRIKTSYPVVAYQFNPILNDFSNGASLLIPTNGLDNDYLVMGWSTANPITITIPGAVMEGMPDHMAVTVIAVQPATHVTVQTTHPTLASPDGGIPEANQGDAIEVDMDAFDVFNLTSRQNLQFPTGDFTGTRVTSNNPIAVFSSSMRSLVPGFSLDKYNPRPPEPSGDYDICCTEHFEQQMFPVSSLGMKFVVTRTPIRSTGAPEPDFLRILATKPGTTVTTSLTNFPSFTLGAGETADFWATEDFVMTSNEAIMVGQYAVCQGFIESYSVGGDPEFIVFPPTEQYRKDYIFLTPPTFQKDYVIIAAPEGAQVMLDGKDVGGEITTLCQKYPAGIIDSVSYNAIRCDVEDGIHRVEATEPVGITAYGYYSVGSYGYPGGADVKQINMQ
jgi:hypothetical protein